jgi:SNF2 family DNA or RNA helicase
VEIQVMPWFARRNGMSSTLLEVTEIIRNTQKAYQISGNAMVRPSTTCWKCGKVLTDPVSIELGIGPVCAGIDQRDSMTQEEKDAYIKEFSSKNTVSGLWIPKSVIENLREFEASIPRAEYNHDSAIVKDAKSEPEYDVSCIIWKDRICIKSLYQYAQHCKSIGNGTWEPKRKFWHYPVDNATAYAVVRAFKDVLSKRISEDIIAMAAEFASAQKTKVEVDLPDIPNTVFEPWLHQKRAYWFANSLSGAMLALDMGTGKTKVTIDLIVNSEDKKILIICPKQVIKVWPKEFAKHSNENIPVIQIDDGSLDGKTDKAEEAFTNNDRVVIVVNYETAWRNPTYQEYTDRNGNKKKRVVGYERMAGWIQSKQWDCIVLDESHKIKQFDGKAAKFCHSLEKISKRRFCLTGTPMTHSPMDVWSQYCFLNSSIFGKSYYAFRNRYAIMGGYMDMQIVGYKNQDELNEKFYSIAYRVMADDVQDLPELLHIPSYFELSGKARRLYEAAEDEMSVAIGESNVNTAIVLTKLLRCQQITSGYLPTEMGIVKVDNGKSELLEELLDDIGEEPVIVFARFQHDLDEIKKVAEKLKRKYGEISGSNKSGLDDKAELSDGVQVCGVNIQAGGVGIDLTKSHYAIYYSVGYSLGDYEQSIKRIHRPGQEEKVKIWHLICEKSVDEKVYGALVGKKQVINSILER